MESKHTPGPWEVKKTDRPGIGPRWDVLHGIYYVADPMTSSAYRDNAETAANARLIAAAPDLLAASQAALKYDEAIQRAAEKGESWVQSDELDSLYLDWITKTRAAIAKAKGE